MSLCKALGKLVCLRCVGATACERPSWNADTPDVSSGRPTETGSSRLDLQSDVKPCEASRRTCEHEACGMEHAVWAPQICALSVCHSLVVLGRGIRRRAGSGYGKSVKLYLA